jgi:NADH:ubiquinone oxidoreductase subunit H
LYTFLLGGWLPVLNIWVFYLIPGPVWLALKTLIFLFLFVFVELLFLDIVMIDGVRLESFTSISLAWFYLHWPRSFELF